MNGNDNLYRILGIPVTASDAEIRRAYRQLALKCHPDKLQATSSDPESISHVNQSLSAAIETFHAITKAYTILGNPTERAKYDTSIGQKYSVSSHPKWHDDNEETKAKQRQARMTREQLRAQLDAIEQQEYLNRRTTQQAIS